MKSNIVKICTEKEREKKWQTVYGKQGQQCRNHCVYERLLHTVYFPFLRMKALPLALKLIREYILRMDMKFIICFENLEGIIANQNIFCGLNIY